MNRAERRFRSYNKYKKRVKLFIHIWGEYAKTAYILKSTSTPCNCGICRREKYSRKQKHKNSEE